MKRSNSGLNNMGLSFLSCSNTVGILSSCVRGLDSYFIAPSCFFHPHCYFMVLVGSWGFIYNDPILSIESKNKK